MGTFEIEDGRMSIWDHLAELRRRVIYSLTLIILSSFTAYFFRTPIMNFIMKPSNNKSFIFIHPTEAFISYLKMSLFIGILGAVPFVFYQTWRFVLPALRPIERRALRFCFLLGGVMFYSGSAFAFYVALPAALRFLIAAGGELLKPQFTVGNYVSFVSLFTLLMGLVFELPLVVLVLVRLGITSREFLRQRRRHVIVLCWIVAAILTPPDVVTQAFMAVPLMLLYELSLVLAAVAERRGKEAIKERG